jgi:hypothetical protein
MKLVTALLFFSVIAQAQYVSQYTDSRNYTGTASQDTLKGVSTVKANTDSTKIVRLWQININTAVAADSIYVWEATNATGARYIGKYIIPATPAPAQASISFGPKGLPIDSAYVIVSRKKTSDVTLIFDRQR